MSTIINLLILRSKTIVAENVNQALNNDISITLLDIAIKYI